MSVLSKKYIDLFAGCGGVSTGLGMVGWDGIIAIEKDPMAFATFKHNLIDETGEFSHFSDWPEWLSKEAHVVQDLLGSEEARANLATLSGEISLVIGGPPCQGFSVGGKRDGADPRNQLVFDQLEVVSIVKPDYVVIENVTGFARQFKSKTDGRKVSMADEVVNQLRGLGYTAAYEIVNSADFGVPQTRKRVIVLGIRNDKIGERKISLQTLYRNVLSEISVSQREELSLPTDRYLTIGEALTDLSGMSHVTCPDATRFDTSKYIKPRSPYEVFMRRGIKTGSVPDSHRMSRHSDKVLRMYDDAHSLGLKGRLPREFLLSHNTKSRKKFLLNLDAPSSTVTTHPDEFIHFKHSRNITVREMARIQSFPDNFEFKGRYTLNGDRRGLDVPRCAQVGNAIPPLLGRAIGQVIEKIDLLISSNEEISTNYKYNIETKQLNLMVNEPM
jgi:DNA (cytosine-5)-methyltransferase 1